jgi:ABC-type dipeptide/oligopeptide/nickel transport system ATPase component
MSIINSTPVRVIAIVGCDGSGKSTLTASLVNELAARMPTEHIYLGQSSGRIGEWISQLPVIGAPCGRYLRSKAAHVHEKPSTPPGNITALVIYLLSCWRAYKFRKMLCKSQQGFLLITDRYPQVEVPGFRFDGPQLAKTTGGNGWIKMLRQRELKLYQWMASYLPVLLIRLGIDEQTAFARKPDHQLAALQEKIACTPGAKSMIINAIIKRDDIIAPAIAENAKSAALSADEYRYPAPTVHHTTGGFPYHPPPCRRVYLPSGH